MMNRAIRAGFSAGAALSALVIGTPVLAQGKSGANEGDAIIVTARRVEERLQDVPISMTVFNQEAITDRNVVTATDLATYTPSLSVNQRFGPEKASYSIRGFVQDAGTAPSVGVYFADVVAPRAQGGTTSGGTVPVGSFMDLQNVQVLKGPQGTLFGRNTTGGAVLLVPNRPTDRLEGWVQGSIGDYSLRRVEGVLNVPLAETFKVRVAVDRNTRDGYMKNHSGVGPKDYNDVNYFAARLGILAELTPDLENYTLATYSHSFGHGYGARVVACDPNETDGYRGLFARAGCDQIDRQNARGDGKRDVEIGAPRGKIDLTQWQVINTTTWRASDSVTIKNIASYSEFTEDAYFSLGGGNFFISDPAPSLAGLGIPFPLTPGRRFDYVVLEAWDGQHTSAQSAFTEELQFQGTAANGRLTWQAGAYLEVSRPRGWSAARNNINLYCESVATLDCENPIFIGTVSQSSTKTSFTSRALYAQGTYDFTDQLSMTGGLRYTWDTTKSTARNTRALPPTFTTLQCNDPLRFPGATPGRGAIVNDINDCLYRYPSAKSDKPTWLIDIDYKPTPDILLYAKYARGYRMGGINPTNVGLEAWDPEKVDTYEVGAKASFRGAVPGYFNVAAFYNDFRDMQLNANAFPIPGSGFGGAQPVVNAGKSRIQGVEVDGSVTLFDSLRLDVGYTYLDTKLKAFDPPPIPAGAPYAELVPTAVVGDPLALSPKHRLSLTATYTLPLDESIGEISLGATFVYTGEQYQTRADDRFVPFFDGTNPPGTLPYKTVSYKLHNANLGLLPSTSLLNLNVNWDGIMGSNFDAAFFMTNVTNEVFPVGVGSSLGGLGVESLLYSAPRMWGFRLKYHFGQ